MKNLFNTISKFLFGNQSNICKYFEMTNQEVEQAFKNEAVRRGFKEGVYFKECKRQSSVCIVEGICNQNMYFIEYEDGEEVLLSGGRAIFCNGIWAEIIPTKTKEEAEKLLNCKIVN